MCLRDDESCHGIWNKSKLFYLRCHIKIFGFSRSHNDSRFHSELHAIFEFRDGLLASNFTLETYAPKILTRDF